MLKNTEIKKTISGLLIIIGYILFMIKMHDKSHIFTHILYTLSILQEKNRNHYLPKTNEYD